MPRSLHEKPKFLSEVEKQATFASRKGWVRQKADGSQEIIVAISRLSSKQVPGIRSIKTEKLNYNLKVDNEIKFIVTYSFPVSSDTLTSESKLSFLLGIVPLEASFTEQKEEQELIFTYSIPSTPLERDSILEKDSLVTLLGLTDISLSEGEKIYLDNENYTDESSIKASLNLPYSFIQVNISRPSDDV